MVLRAQKEPQDPGPVLLAEQATHACPCLYARTRRKSFPLFLPPFDGRKAPGPLANTGKLTTSSSLTPHCGHTLLGVGEGKYRMRESGRRGRKPGAPRGCLSTPALPLPWRHLPCTGLHCGKKFETGTPYTPCQR